MLSKIWIEGNIKFVILISLLILGTFFNISSEVNAETFYISPNGSDSNPGTSDWPWKTFSFAISKLRPGNALILMDGTYTKTTTGLPNINCSSPTNANNGVAGDPITIRAQNERKATLKSDGNVEALKVVNCSYVFSCHRNILASEIWLTLTVDSVTCNL
ncbi:MAG TPA: hypothetical protein VHT73_09630 [Thermodesulfobacteriota bacterium]|nr:hypothetical protein [Thermodesulfobacteriota bacterium]